MAVADGVVVRIEPFTGPLADSPWWLDTQAIFIEHDDGVVVYGELLAKEGLMDRQVVQAGQVIGNLTPVLAKGKGRPVCMLHLDLHTRGTRQAPGWDHRKERPSTLLDPTPYLLDLVRRQEVQARNP